ncbi:ATPase [Pseudomonas coronafaciens]|uniref:ATPase n=1 Tax=Pseudomonas coronafaciens TaxID=53409 RepID=UPI0012D84B41|nr:ATPase [Pseudomonas coronafaciens]
MELGEELTIGGAHQAYFNQNQPRSRFVFQCSSPQCRTLKPIPKITAVNYDIHPTEKARVKSPHYKDNEHYAHHADCEWVLPDDDDGSDAPLPGETELQTRTRLAKRQLTSIIDIFVPPTQPEQPVVRPPRAAPGDENEARPNRRQGGGGTEGTRTDRKHSTGDLRELVDYYHDTREALKELFPQVTINVSGRGEIPLRSYFKKVAWAKRDTAGYVYSGGGRIERREGAGFVFKFFDKVADKDAFLQVSDEVMTQQRSRRYINELLDQARLVRYFTFYFLGVFTHDDANDIMVAHVNDLRCLAIDLGPSKT